MQNLKNGLLIQMLSMAVFLSGCTKENSTTTPPDASALLNTMITGFKSATNSDLLLVKYHQQAGLGNHDSCFFYWHQFNQEDSLFSFHFYEYCRIIYAKNGGQKYDKNNWNWNMGNNGMMGNGNNGMMNNDNWQCGLDTLQFQNWNGSGDFIEHDSLMYNKMEKYGMMGYFSNQANQSYSNMHALRNEHYDSHNYHW
jgi:hypothetical protein